MTVEERRFKMKIDDIESDAASREDVSPGSFFIVKMLGVIAQILLDRLVVLSK